MEFIILFFPIIEIWKFKKRQRKAREEPGHTKFSKYSIAALERALRDDIDRLEEFAATKDFTSENILFLKRVESWKEKWKLAEIKVRNGKISPVVILSFYDTAEQIFNTLVHRESSGFPLNLEEDVYLPLDRVFGCSNPGSQKSQIISKYPCGAKAIVAPFADDILANVRRIPDKRGFRGPGKGYDYNDERPPAIIPTRPQNMLPMGFGAGVFDKAEVAVKQMVLTNTWIRYACDYGTYFPGMEKGCVLMFPVNIKLCGLTTPIRELFDRCRVRNISTNKLAMEEMFPEKGFRRIAIVVVRWLDISYTCAYILMRLFSRTRRGGRPSRCKFLTGSIY